MHDEVRMYVKVPPDRLDVTLLRRAVDGFAELLGATGSGAWTVSDLGLGSVITAARPAESSDLDVDEEFERILAGLIVLSEAPVAPRGWSDAMLKSVANLGDVTDYQGVEGIEMSFGDHATLLVTSQTCQNARSALANGAESLGAVTGLVDRFYSRGGHRELGLVDEATSDTVTVRYGRTYDEAVRDLIGQRVTAWGLIRRTPGGKKQQLQLEGYAMAEPRSALGVDDVVGILGADWTCGQSSVDWVRGQRDD